MLLVGLGLIGSFASVALASAIAGFIEEVDHRTHLAFGGFLWFAIGVLVKVSLPFFQERISTQISSRVKQDFRKELLAFDFSQTEANSAEISLLATRGLDALDAYFGKFLPQFIYTLVVTPIMVCVFFVVDPLSALILVFTIPLIPLFMVFIGRATKTEQDRQFESLSGLSKHFGEVVRGLSTLKLFGRVNHQFEVLHSIGENLRIRTMKVLRISFLSGFALELAASLSVALIAVTVGFRLIDGLIPFATAMFLLILAPEAYLPLRMIGANYHASSEGIAAASKILDVFDARESSKTVASLPEPGFEIWLGSSGVGKSRKMESLLIGNERDVAWMPQRPGLFAGSVESNITGGKAPDPRALANAVRFAALGDVPLSSKIDDFGRGLSGGQAERVSLARAIYRLETKKLQHLFLDEPTASIDIEKSEQIWTNLAELSKSGISITAITHQEQFASLANRVIRFED